MLLSYTDTCSLHKLFSYNRFQQCPKMCILALMFLWLLSLPATLCAAFLFRLPFPAVFATMYIAEDWLKAFFCVRYYLTGKWLKPVTPEGKRGLELYRDGVSASSKG